MPREAGSCVHEGVSRGSTEELLQQSSVYGPCPFIWAANIQGWSPHVIETIRTVSDMPTSQSDTDSPRWGFFPGSDCQLKLASQTLAHSSLSETCPFLSPTVSFGRPLLTFSYLKEVLSLARRPGV